MGDCDDGQVVLEKLVSEEKKSIFLSHRPTGMDGEKYFLQLFCCSCCSYLPVSLAVQRRGEIAHVQKKVQNFTAFFVAIVSSIPDRYPISHYRERNQ